VVPGLLFSTLKKYKGERTIVFCNTVEICKSVCTHLEKTGYSVLVLHSEMHPKKRRASFEAFNAGEGRILVATDVASRGLDLGNKVEHVVLYDFPTNVLDYLHRVGRTARAGKPGHATAFIGRSDHRLATTIRVRILPQYA
jgi:superfamily II DNA/RNA helicase